MENPFFTALCLESNPIIDIQKTATAIGLSYNTVSKAVSIYNMVKNIAGSWFFLCKELAARSG